MVTRRSTGRANWNGWLRTWRRLVADLETRVQRPSQEEIARRAYEIFEHRGSVHGYDLDDWLQAERELSGE
jgi:hypothetical protein